MSDDALVLREDRDGVATLTLNRPSARNALSVGMMGALQAAFDAIATDKNVRVVILAGGGPAFCAGHDLKELRANPGRQAYEAVFGQCAKLMTSIVMLPKPVIARVHGVATAAGCQLVASCDLAVAAEDARFATPGVNIGLFCSTPMVALSRAIGRKQAMEMLLTGSLIDAETARTQLGPHQPRCAGSEARRRDGHVCRRDRDEIAAYRGHRQEGVLRPSRARPRASLCLLR